MMTLYDWWAYRVRLRPIWWTMKRPWCWCFGHRTHRLSGERREGYATHFCTRCLAFGIED